MTTGNLLTAAIWSYSLAAAAFGAFALRMTLRWRGGLSAVLLLSASVASTLWAAAEITLALWPSAATWVASNSLDTIRYALWFAFLYSLVSRIVMNTARSGAKIVPWWLIVATAIGLISSFALPDTEPLRSIFGDRGGMVVYAVRVGLAVVGLVLVEGQRKGRWEGRTRTNKLLFFDHEEDWLGRVARVRVERTSPWSLYHAARRT